MSNGYLFRIKYLNFMKFNQLIQIFIIRKFFYKLTARQNERRLEEVKAECSQLRNRLTLVEKNLNDGDSEGKLHRKYFCRRV